MRRFISALVVVATVVGGVVAAAQTPGRPVPAVLITPMPEPVGVIMRVLPSNEKRVVDRIFSFDADGDDRVTSDELPERMQGLVGRGDQDDDGFLTSEEVARLINRTPAGVRSGTLAFAVKPLRMADVIGDLRLPQPKRDVALALVQGYAVPRNVNDPASVDLYARMRELLDDEEYENFVAAAARVGSRRVVVSGVIRH